MNEQSSLDVFDVQRKEALYSGDYATYKEITESLGIPLEFDEDGTPLDVSEEREFDLRRDSVVKEPEKKIPTTYLELRKYLSLKSPASKGGSFKFRVKTKDGAHFDNYTSQNYTVTFTHEDGSKHEELFRDYEDLNDSQRILHGIGQFEVVSLQEGFRLEDILVKGSSGSFDLVREKDTPKLN